MSIGERLRFFRKLRGMTQKYLGMQVGLHEKTADIRMNQYESGTRTPKEDLVNAMASALSVSPMAIDIPPIENGLGLMHTLFALEDIYGLKVDKLDGETCLHLDKTHGSLYISTLEDLNAWLDQAQKFRNGEISKEKYDDWRYHFPDKSPHTGWYSIS